MLMMDVIKAVTSNKNNGNSNTYQQAFFGREKTPTTTPSLESFSSIGGKLGTLLDEAKKTTVAPVSSPQKDTTASQSTSLVQLLSGIQKQSDVSFFAGGGHPLLDSQNTTTQLSQNKEQEESPQNNERSLMAGASPKTDDDCCRETVRILQAILALMPTASPNWNLLLGGKGGKDPKEDPKEEKKPESLLDRARRYTNNAMLYANLALSGKSNLGENVSSVGKSITKAAAFAGPAAPVVAVFGALIEAVGGAISKIKEWNAALRAEDMRLAQFSGAMAQVMAQAEIRQMQLDIKQGEATAAGSQGREEAYSRFQSAAQPIDIAWTNAKNAVMEAIWSKIADALEGINSILGLSTSGASTVGTGQQLFANVANDYQIYGSGPAQ